MVIKNKLLKSNQRGSLLAELMIGLAMGALTVLGVTTIYAQFESQKRITVQVGETVSNATLAILPLQSDAKMAGYGVNIKDLMNCDIVGYNSNTDKNFTFSLEPVKIIPAGKTGNANPNSDMIKFVASDTSAYYSPVKLTSDYGGTEAVYKVDNRFGFAPGDMVISISPPKKCTLSQVTNIPGQPGQTDNLSKNTGMYDDPITGEKVKAVYNQAGGVKDPATGAPIDYDVDSRLLNIGRSPTSVTYYIENNQLKRINDLDSSGGGVALTVADNVVLMKAQIALDTDSDGAAESWVDEVTDKADYQYVKGIRMAIIARTSQKQGGSACKTTENNEFAWDGGTMDISVLGDDWGCYRYRMIQTTVPFRNLIWMK